MALVCVSLSPALYCAGCVLVFCVPYRAVVAALAAMLHTQVTMSYIEVYNENIRDLLVGSEENLELREDPIKGPTVAGVSEVEALNTGARHFLDAVQRVRAGSEQGRQPIREGGNKGSSL